MPKDECTCTLYGFDPSLCYWNSDHRQKREGFLRMIDDAVKHRKIYLILTKSVLRFARNTVDSLSTIRLLKENGGEVYFEKEYIQNGGNT